MAEQKVKIEELTLKEFEDIMDSFNIPRGLLNSINTCISNVEQAELWEVMEPFLNNDDLQIVYEEFQEQEMEELETDEISPAEQMRFTQASPLQGLKQVGENLDSDTLSLMAAELSIEPEETMTEIIIQKDRSGTHASSTQRVVIRPLDNQSNNRGKRDGYLKKLPGMKEVIDEEARIRRVEKEARRLETTPHFWA